jgi:ribosome-associated translation inhibitor RaiA
MTTNDFSFEFHSDRTQPEEPLRAEAERRLRSLASEATDVVGAAVVIEPIAHGRLPYLFEATVTVYVRPEHISATEKAETAQGALKGALDAAERQVRAKRDRLRERGRQP